MALLWNGSLRGSTRVLAGSPALSVTDLALVGGLFNIMSSRISYKTSFGSISPAVDPDGCEERPPWEQLCPVSVLAPPIQLCFHSEAVSRTFMQRMILVHVCSWFYAHSTHCSISFMYFKRGDSYQIVPYRWCFMTQCFPNVDSSLNIIAVITSINTSAALLGRA